MPTQELSGTKAPVTGASRGFGRAIAAALAKHGAHAAGVADDHGRLEELRAQLGDTFTPVAADPVVAGQLLDKDTPHAGPRRPGRGAPNSSANRRSGRCSSQ